MARAGLMAIPNSRASAAPGVSFHPALGNASIQNYHEEKEEYAYYYYDDEEGEYYDNEEEDGEYYDDEEDGEYYDEEENGDGDYDDDVFLSTRSSSDIVLEANWLNSIRETALRASAARR